MKGTDRGQAHGGKISRFREADMADGSFSKVRSARLVDLASQAG